MKHPVSIGDSIAYSINRSARLLRKHFLSIAADLGVEITPEQWFVLNKLRLRDGRSQVELTEDIFGDRPNLTRMLATMERKGLVSRTPDSEDKRRMRVHLTDSGRSLHDAFAANVESQRARLFKGINTTDMATLRRVLSTMESNMNKS